MNELANERSELKDAVVRTGKVLGGLVLGAASGYAMAKGVEMIIPVEERFIDLYEGTVTTALALSGAFVAAEVAE